MALVGKARLGGNIHQTLPGAHPLATKIEPAHHDVAPRAGAVQRSEIPAQAPAVPAADLRQGVEGHILHKTGMNILPGPLRRLIIKRLATGTLAADNGQGLRQVVQSILFLQRLEGIRDRFQQRLRGAT